MAVASVQVATAVRTTAGGATTTVSFASPPVAGHAVIAYIVDGVSTNPTLAPTLADNQGVGNVWVQDIAKLETSNGQMAAIWRCQSIGAVSGTFTLTVTHAAATNNYSEITMQEFNSALSLDTTAFSVTNVAGVTTVTGTALASSDEAICVCYTEDSSGSGGSTITVATGYTNTMLEADTSTFIAGLGAYKIVAVATAPTAVFTSSNSPGPPFASVGVLATYVVAAAGATATKGRILLLGVGV